MDYKELIEDLNKESEWYGMTDENAALLMMQASQAITELLNQAEEAEMERDMAINDLSLLPKCKTCFYRSKTEKPFICIGCINGSEWKWRGIKDEQN